MRGNLGRALSQEHIFLNSTSNNGTQRRKHIYSMIEYQQHVDAVTTEKIRRSYTFCDVQAGMRSILIIIISKALTTRTI